jgi:hypothetical protein
MARRTKAEIRTFDNNIFLIVADVKPATCRQIYYRAVVAGLVAKDDRGYRLVCESLSRLRWDGAVAWDWITDETRAIRAPGMWRDADSGVAAFAEAYRRDAWREQPAWIEVWCESDSLAGTLVDVTWDLGVPLYSGRGFSSLSALRMAAQQMSDRWDEREQPAAVCYLGDLDPAGWEASRAAHRVLLRHLDDLGFDEYESDSMLTFERLSVNPEDIDVYGLSTGGPPKRKGPGSKSWWDEGGPQLDVTVEAEAFEPDVMRELIRTAILERADVDALNVTRRVEELERNTLRLAASTKRFTDLARYDGEGTQ